MEHRVYRSLDYPSTIFKIKGKFIVIFGIGAGVGLVLFLLLGFSVSGIVGLVTFLVILAVSYLVTMVIQSRMSTREFSRFLASRDMPDFIVVHPDRLYRKLPGYHGDKTEEKDS